MSDSSKINIQQNFLNIFLTVSFIDTGNDETTLDALGSKFSLIGNMETMRIDIVVSEHGKVEKRKGKNKSTRLFIDSNSGMIF